MKRTTALLLFLLCSPVARVWAENDGVFYRAEETTVIGPVLDGYQLEDGIVAGPTGTKYNGNIYLAAHTSFWPRWNRGLPLCPSVNQSEVVSVWKLPATNTGIYQKATLVGQLSPCEGFLGTGYWGIDGTIAVGGNGKFYATMARTKCDNWAAGCFDNEYLGTNTTPDNTAYRWQNAPILAASTVTFNGQSRNLHWQGFLALNSFTANPPPPASLFPRLNSSLGPATLWGYVHWGFADNFDLPSHIARVQIVETSTTPAPNWQTTKVFVYANDGTWKEASVNGVLSFVPYDAAGIYNPPGDFNNRSIASLYFDTALQSWFGVSHNTSPNGLAIGCDEHAANWYTSPTSSFYQAPWANDHSTVELTQIGGATTINLRYDTYTQNTLQLGAAVFEVGSGSSRVRYLFRSSTEKICRYKPASWWHPWIGSEITVESVQ